MSQQPAGRSGAPIAAPLPVILHLVSSARSGLAFRTARRPPAIGQRRTTDTDRGTAL
jgi:hypothetical protein